MARREGWLVTDATNAKHTHRHRTSVQREVFACRLRKKSSLTEPLERAAALIVNCYGHPLSEQEEISRLGLKPRKKSEKPVRMLNATFSVNAILMERQLPAHAIMDIKATATLARKSISV
jgi:hypothetical protein